MLTNPDQRSPFSQSVAEAFPAVDLAHAGQLEYHICNHLKDYKKLFKTDTFEFVYAVFVACVAKGSMKLKAQDCYCHICKTRTNRIHACLSCAFFGCFDKEHIHGHAEKHHHNIAIDTKIGGIYCFMCKDYIYDAEFEQISRQLKIRACRIRGIVPSFAWEPETVEEKNIVNSHDISKQIVQTNIGLRGFYNLGSTCYMNCILQVLTHTSMLRYYFLSDTHKCKNSDEDKTCISCETRCIFQEMYSEERSPYSLPSLLRIIWQKCPDFRGDEPQDAHEFLLAYLNLLHLSETTSTENCLCAVHEIFGGLSQSDVHCENCGFLSTTHEEFRHISVSSTDKADCSSDTLQDCLTRYTAPEQVKKNCEKCHSSDCSKQVTIRKLPFVVVIHKKRPVSNKSKKVSFPEIFDMTAFVSSKRTELKRQKNYIRTFGYKEPRYHLFGVVEHKPTFINKKITGHYVSHIRQHSNCWFKCDDDEITKTTLQEVLEIDWYCLFYQKQSIDCKFSRS